MSILYTLNGLRHFVVCGCCVIALAACASMPANGPHPTAAAATEPLQRITLPADTQRNDLLAHLIAAELAGGRNDLDGATREYVTAAALSEDPSIAEQATHMAIAGKRWDPARTALTRWQTLRPDASGVRQARAMLALHDQQFDAAYADLLKLLQQPGEVGWPSVSQALLGAGNKAQAGEMLERLLLGSGDTANAIKFELIGPNPETIVAVSQLAVRLDRRALAQALADQALSRYGTPESYVWAAQLKLNSGDQEAARKLFVQALHKNPSDAKTPRLRIAYAGLLGDMGDNLAAARVLADGPQNDLSYSSRAAYLARSDDKAAKAQVGVLYKEVKALPEPRTPARVNLLGQLAELLEQKSEALKWYAQVPEDDDHWFGAQMRTAVLLNDSGKTGDALTLLHDVQAQSGDDGKQLGDAFLLEAELLTRLKRNDEAIAAYGRGLLVLPDDTRLIYARALLNGDLGHVDGAVRDLRHVLELKPDDADAMNALGYTLADRTDQKTEALALIEKALKLKPDEPAIIDSLGWVQYRLGNLDSAVQALRSAYAKQPDPEIAAHLGEVLWVSGQKDEAKKIWAQGQAKDGGNKVLIETVKRLAS